ADYQLRQHSLANSSSSSSSSSSSGVVISGGGCGGGSSPPPPHCSPSDLQSQIDSLTLSLSSVRSAAQASALQSQQRERECQRRVADAEMRPVHQQQEQDAAAVELGSRCEEEL